MKLYFKTSDETTKRHFAIKYWLATMTGKLVGYFELFILSTVTHFSAVEKSITKVFRSQIKHTVTNSRFSQH